MKVNNPDGGDPGDPGDPGDHGDPSDPGQRELKSPAFDSLC